MNITAVVVTYNRLELLKKSVACLQRQDGMSQIVVVDNGSTDGTHEWLDAQSGLTVIHQDNVGGSGGFYTGIRRAYDDGADWIWCMDDDVFATDGCLKHMLACVGDDDSLGIVVPRRMHDGSVFTHEFQQYNFTNAFSSIKHGKLSKLQVTGPTPIVGADFEGPMISRKVVEKIGLPNRDFFIFCNDTDYCLRAHLAGFSMLYVPSAILDKHKFFENDSWSERNQKKKWKRYYQVRNEAYMNHHYGRNWAVRYLRSFMGVLGYVVPALCSMPFSKAWQMKDISTLWQAYRHGIAERLGKRES